MKIHLAPAGGSSSAPAWSISDLLILLQTGCENTASTLVLLRRAQLSPLFHSLLLRSSAIFLSPEYAKMFLVPKVRSYNILSQLKGIFIEVEKKSKSTNT